MYHKLLVNRVINLFSDAVSDASRAAEEARVQPKVRVLFVCMGNICRSPTAQGVLEKLLEEAGLTGVIEVDSAGTYAYHSGKPSDPRAIAAAAKRGYDLIRHRARRLSASDFEKFDYILAMDYENLHDIQEIAPPGTEGKLGLCMEFARTPGQPEVPDPYYGGGGGFERVLDLVEDAARGLLAHIRVQHGL